MWDRCVVWCWYEIEGCGTGVWYGAGMRESNPRQVCSMVLVSESGVLVQVSGMILILKRGVLDRCVV